MTPAEFKAFVNRSHESAVQSLEAVPQEKISDLRSIVRRSTDQRATPHVRTSATPKDESSQS